MAVPDIEHLRAYILERIRWHSGSGELSSRDEVVRDAVIVEELRDVLDVMDGRQPSRTEGNRTWERKLDRAAVRTDQP